MNYCVIIFSKKDTPSVYFGFMMSDVGNATSHILMNMNSPIHINRRARRKTRKVRS
jgi:hypothetical protein